MLRVNLLRTRADQADKTAVTDINYSAETDPRKIFIKATILKFVVISLGSIILIAYENYNIGELNIALRAKTTKRDALVNEIKQKQTIADGAREFQKQILDLEARIKAIKDLSKVRLQVIRAVDYIQNIIPEKVWIKRLNFTAAKFDIEGGALSDEQLNRFIEALESKSYFSNVILLKAMEQKTKEGTTKIFSITCDVTGLE